MTRFLAIIALCLLPAVGRTQVIVHQAALDQLAGIAPASQAAPEQPTPQPMTRHAARRHMPRRHGPMPQAVAFAAPPPLPVIAQHAPMVRPAAVQPHGGAAPPARTTPAALPPSAIATLRFTAGSADLPAGAAATLKPICTAAAPAGTVTVAAPAPASPGDPSVGMRLSMQRAFAVRDALTACGIAPARVIPRAIGAAGGGDPDMARISLGAVSK